MKLSRKFITLTVTKIELDMIIGSLSDSANHYDDHNMNNLSKELGELNAEQGN